MAVASATARAAGWAAAAALVIAGAPASGRERVLQTFDERTGLAVSEIQSIAQDSRGFLWIGTTGGLVRFDGVEMRPWAPDSVRHVVHLLEAGPLGGVVVGAWTQPLYEVTGDGVERVLSPEGKPFENWASASYGADGSLWIALPDTLLRRDLGGEWRGIGPRAFASGSFQYVGPGPDGSMLVGTDVAIARLDADGAVHPVAPISPVFDVKRLPDGPLVALTRDGRLYRIEGGDSRLLIQGEAHGRGLAVRGDVIWASIDQYVYAVRPGERPEVIAPTPGMPTGRPILVDAEGTLWIGGYRGLMAMPEPETVTWNDLDGLPSPTHARFVTKQGDRVYIGTWYGAGIIERHGIAWTARKGPYHSGRFCPDGWGRVWTGDLDRGFAVLQGEERRTFPHPGLRGVYAYSPRPDGTLWLGTDEGVFLTPAGSGPPRRPAATPPAAWGDRWDGLYVEAILEDPQGILWVASGEQIAHAPAEEVALSAGAEWSVEEIPEADLISDLVATPSGTIWAGTMNMGVQRHTPSGWELIPGSRDLGSLRVHGVVPSPAGGAWVLAVGGLVRVLERPDLPAGWEVHERLGTWQGVPNQTAGDLVEEADGRLWLASLAGVTVVPPEARHALRLPPRVELVDLLVDGKRQPLDRSLMLPYRRNRLEMRVAVLSFRDRNLIRTEIRLGPDAPWLESRELSVRFVDLAPGRYAPEIRASLDGAEWSQMAASFSFRVHRPWFLQLWAFGLFGLIAAVTLYTVYRIRVAFLLRLERQRTRIAMDLHDEMGSGLGSIGILAGLAADEDLDDSSRRGLSAKIAEAAGELGSALTDIVWSLREGSETLESLAIRLTERGGRLFPDQLPEFRTVFPERWPPGRMPLEVRRNLQLIGVEALHNAARHASPRRVVLGLEPQGRLWRLWVEDDGRGLVGEALSGATRGHGLRNMRSRARQIGAEIQVRPREGGGTIVEVLFHPQSAAAPPARGGFPLPAFARRMIMQAARRRGMRDDSPHDEGGGRA